MKLRHRAALVAATVSLTACASVQSVDTSKSATEIVRDKNYQVGQALSASVGEPIIKVKDYVLTTNSADAFEATESGQVRGGPVVIRLTATQRLPVVGTSEEGGKTYRVVRTDSFGLLVDENGIVQDRVINGYGIRNIYGQATPLVKMLYRFKVTPETLRLSPIKNTSTSADGTNTNFEIIFNGIDGQAAHFQYREFSPDDLAREAFYQELTYPLSTKSIRFKKLIIEVTSIDAGHIDYRVVSDQ